MTSAAQGADGLAALSCPSASLCAGINDAGLVVSSADPGAPDALVRQASNSAMASASATPGSPRSIASSAARIEVTYSGALAST